MTSDMTAVIQPKSDQLNADSLLSGPITITVSEVSIRPNTEQPCSIHYEGDNGKPYKPCKSMARVLVNLWGPDAKQYVGKSLTLYCDPTVTWGGLAVGGLRISHMSHIDKQATMVLTATKGNKKPFVVKPLTNTPAPKMQVEQIDTDALRQTAESFARQGGAALTDHLATLTKPHKDALRPFGEAIRAIANGIDQNAATGQQAQTEAQSLPASRPAMWTADGTTQYQTENEYLAAYEAIVTRMYGSGDASALLKFDTQNKPHVEASGLAGAIKAINERVRRPSGQQGFEV